MTVWVGIDLGTQSVRAMAVTDAGDVVGAASRPLTSRRDGDRHEQDPEQWYAALAAACAEALRDVPSDEVGGVAVDATSGTVLLVDDAGAPRSPALMYDDRRAAAFLPRVNEAGGAVWDRLGYRAMQPPWALPKLLWLLREFPGDFRLAHQNDYVNRRLVGRATAADLSNALKTGVDLMAEDWPRDVMAALGVPDAVLPPVVRPGSVLGTVCAAASKETGLLEGTPVIAGTTDGCAAQLGAGATTPGSWNSVLGTTLVLKGVTREPVRDPLGVVYSHRAPDGGWLPGGASSTGTGVLSRDLPGRDLDKLSYEAARRPALDAVTYPLVSPGERFPFNAPEARGFTLGEIDDDVARYAAAIRGAAFIERLCFDYLDLLGAPVDGEIILTGGAARSRYVTQVRADALGRPVTLRENAEPALGMALLAQGLTATMARTREVVEPRPADQAHYLRFVDALAARGWLPAHVAAHAHERSAR
ncbi:FGGY-family carbohydrate kinase [Actinocorallia sp. A-T 12471]|uniref:FGGY-family carbohydrate kinase n=1 Tax=Actinocorallia sp. A-T 12471 TaxID=3089813 RepID=UPI0029D01AA8|nr:FGGY family carbohydrate kinase [Actinocorallia sp. A-T 12471]MDX6744204.1 FGGY family carbohydrate kinase [Actinocorallia sp. A-T 12471]